MSPAKWEAIPRISPDYLARWEYWNGKWRLVVTDRWWNNKDSVTTDALVSGPPPGDGWLAKLGFAPVEGSGWVQDGRAWERPVYPVCT